MIDEHTARHAELQGFVDSTVDEDELIPAIAETEDILADEVVIIPLCRVSTQKRCRPTRSAAGNTLPRLDGYLERRGLVPD